MNQKLEKKINCNKLKNQIWELVILSIEIICPICSLLGIIRKTFDLPFPVLTILAVISILLLVILLRKDYVKRKGDYNEYCIHSEQDYRIKDMLAKELFELPPDFL